MDLQEFQFVITHRKGNLHSNADSLSRLPTPSNQEDLIHNHVDENHEQETTSDCDISNAISIDSTINLRDAQRQDPAISKVIEYKEKNLPKCFWFNFSRLSVRSKRGSLPTYTIIIPGVLIIEPVLKAVHDSPMARHLGVKRTLDRVRLRYFWPEMASTVETFVRKCDRP
jgi:hypothetical protein